MAGTMLSVLCTSPIVLTAVSEGRHYYTHLNMRKLIHREVKCPAVKGRAQIQVMLC